MFRVFQMRWIVIGLKWYKFRAPLGWFMGRENFQRMDANRDHEPAVVGRVTPCAPIGVMAKAVRRGLTRPAAEGLWFRLASNLWRFSPPFRDEVLAR